VKECIGLLSIKPVGNFTGFINKVLRYPQLPLFLPFLNKMKLFSTLFFALFVLQGFAQKKSKEDMPVHIHYLADPEAAERQHSVDITHMKVEVSFEPALGKVNGKVTHEFTTIQKNIDTLFFDAPGITINSATFDGQPVKYTINPEGVVVRFSNKLNWEEKHNIAFTYTAVPKRGIYFIGWNQPENTGKPDINHIRKQIWTQGQGIDNRYWIPMYDCMNDKFITETVVTIESKYKVLSNGKKLAQTDNGNGTSTWHYTMEKPHAGYLLMLAIGNYDIKETKTKRGTPVQFWYYPEFKERMELTSIHTERMIELLEDETGTPYPWGSYSQIMVQNFLYGAMENTSATTFGDFFTIDARGFKDRNYMGVNCHELTHQWFGDLITARGAGDHWMQESFATFYPKLFFKELEGEDAYEWSLRGEYNAALAQSMKDNYPVRHTKGGTVRNYPKGSAVLSMLHYQLGEDNFRRFIQHYLAVNGYKNVEAWDFQKAIKDKLGLNYDWFFDQWIHRGGEPHYKVSYKAAATGIVFKIKQTQETDGHVRYFKMPVDFAVYYKNGTVERYNRWVMDVEEQEVTIPAKGADIDFVLFDEQSKVMKAMDFKKKPAELFAQAEKAKYMIDRYDAIVAMEKISVKEKLEFFKKRFAAEKHQGIRAEIARQLANDKTLSAWYMNIVNDPKSEVKTNYIAATESAFDHKATLELLLKDSSNIVVENALDKLVKDKKIHINDKLKYLDILSEMSGQNNNIKAKWLEHMYVLNVGDKSVVENEFVRLTSPNYEFRTRVNVANVLKRVGFINAQIAANLLDAVLAYNARLSGPAADVLLTLKKNKDYNMIIEAEISKLNAEDQKRVREIFEAMAKK
jgi:aminopeptidase N